MSEISKTSDSGQRPTGGKDAVGTPSGQCNPDVDRRGFLRQGLAVTGCAVALAAALKCDECQIFTDVDGVYTTDPRVESRARRLDRITFEEMLEMASLGSKVLQIRAVEFAGKYNVPLRVLSSFKPGNGTLITYDDEENTMEQALVSGIAFNRDEAQITVTGVADCPGTAYAILGPISDLNVEVDMIIQNIQMRRNPLLPAMWVAAVLVSMGRHLYLDCGFS